MRRHARIAIATVTAALALSSSALGFADGSAVARDQDDEHKCSDYVNIDGFSDSLDGTLFKKRYVGDLSGLAVDSDGSVAALSDRSTLFRLEAKKGTGGKPEAKPIEMNDVVDEKGYPSLDSEALVIDHDGTRVITSEIEPSIRSYDKSGALRGQLPVPDALRVEDPAHPAYRARENRTLEGLTLQPDGKTLIASVEGQLKDDGADADGRPLLRLQTWTRGVGQGVEKFTVAKQYGYPADRDTRYVSEIAAAGDGRLLVLERGHIRNVGNIVRIYLADLSQASEVTGVGKLTGPPTGVKLVKKTLLVDIAKCPDLGATNPQTQPNKLLDNIEGMAVTDHTSDGKLKFLLVSDDNANVKQVTRLYALTATLPDNGS
ncbi:esterase-like activity of phytase family protein [Streptomyces bluensis]|uniref:Esterase-like activity of phytase family protein n=1 Tax=Streptomyces bluensis TaxID=33897 RepID=A0ABW6UDC2_9ACTN